jgi:nucleoside-diphosphate-sugar epimerase
MTGPIHSLRSAPTRVVVTGAAGFIGSHLCERLLAHGHEVVGVDCFTEFYARTLKEENLSGLLASPRFTLRELDLSSDRLDGLLDDVTTVFHLAAQAGVRGSFGDTFAEYSRHNVVATQRLLEQAVGAAQLDAFVYASSSSVYGAALSFPTAESDDRRPVSPYGMTKVATEELAAVYHRTAEVPVVGLRYFTAYGPRQRPDMAFSRFIRMTMAGEAIPVYGDGLQTRDFTFVEDIVDGTLAAAAKGTPGSVYNIGGGTPVRLLDVIELIGTVLGVEPRIAWRPAPSGEARTTAADGHRAETELGFTPRIDLETGLRAQLAWYLDQEWAGCEAIAA